MATKTKQRCPWGNSEDMQAYHDTEWGTPLHDDQALFEFLCLEGAQAGLSWRTILLKREHYRRIFHDFDIKRVAAMKERELEKALLDPGIVRNRLKVYAAVGSVADGTGAGHSACWRH